MHNAYPYTKDLMTLYNISKITCIAQPVPIPGISTISSPLSLSAWARALQTHPDPDLRQYILVGIQEGFHVGFDHFHPFVVG